jgi:hypothetical protein
VLGILLQFYRLLKSHLTNLVTFKSTLFMMHQISHQTVATTAATEVTGICIRCENGYKPGVKEERML